MRQQREIPAGLWDRQYAKFSLYGFLKNLRFFDPYLILFFLEKDITFLQIGFLFSIREVTIYILEIPSGIIADTWGRKKSMIVSFVSYIISFVIFTFSGSYILFAAAMVFFAGGEAFRTGTHKAMMFEYLRLRDMDTYRVEYYGRTHAWAQRGAALSALIAGSIVFFSGSFQTVFLFSIIPYCLNLLLMVSYPRELDGAGRQQEDMSVKSRTWEIMKEHVSGLASMITVKRTRRSLLNFSFFDGVFKAAKDYIQPVIQQFALAAPVLLVLSGEERTAVIAAVVYAVLYLISSWTSERAGRLVTWYGSHERALNRTFAASCAVVLLTGIFLEVSLAGIAVLIFIGYYALHSIRRPVAVGYLSMQIKNSMMATGLSGESQFRTLITAVLAPLFGWCADSFGISWSLIVFSILLSIFALLFRIAPQPERFAADS